MVSGKVISHIDSVAYINIDHNEFASHMEQVSPRNEILDLGRDMVSPIDV